MSQPDRALNPVLASPLVWGAAASLGFYALVLGGAFADPRVERYFAGHPINITETAAFFVALAVLLLKAANLAEQSLAFGRIQLPPPTPGGESVEGAGRLLALVGEIPARRQLDYLVRRLADGLEHIQRTGSADTLDDELKYLADVDRERAHGQFALVRIIIWAIPILGFLGTVVGITMAIASLSPEDLENSLPEVTTGLGMAFDTTALALALSMVLMFTQYVVDRAGQRLLGRVDARVGEELLGRFVRLGGGNDPQLAAVRRMAEAVITHCDRLVERQAELWQGTIEAAHARWNQLARVSEQQLEQALAGGIAKALEAQVLAWSKAQEACEAGNRRHWQQFQETLAAATAALVGQQAELARLGSVLREVVEATGQVASLETTLNRNLAALSGAHQFEETLLSLSAAIHLLSGRLGAAGAPTIDLSRFAGEHRAA